MNNPAKPIPASPSSPPPNQQAQQAVPILARFVHYANRALATESTAEAAAQIVTRFGELMPVDRVVLVKHGWRPRVLAVDTGAEVARQGRFSAMLRRFAKVQRQRTEPLRLPVSNPVADDPRDEAMRQAMNGSHALWLPLARTSDGMPSHSLWLERWNNRPWLDEEMTLLTRLGPFLSASLGAGRRKAVSRWRWVAVIFLLGLFCFPVTESAVAPAQVIAQAPRHVFAPLDGIVKTLHVRPGQWVQPGDLLLSYDTRVLDQQLNEARQQEAVARAELARLESAAYTDAEARAKLPVQTLVVAQAQAQTTFYHAQRAQADVPASIAGMVVLDDEQALVGAPVQLGERLFELANPEQTKLRLHVPVTDSGLVMMDSVVKLRLDSQPLQVWSATVSRIGFDVNVSADDIPSIVVDAQWREQAPTGVLPGQHGSARVEAGMTVLGWQILRKPVLLILGILGV